MSSSSDDSLIGEKVGGYQIVRQLDKGGMGTVYEMFHPRLQKKAALKVLHRNFTTHEEIVRRFWSEALSLSKLNHPHIIQVFDADALHDKRPYILMEFLDGESLAHVAKRKKKCDEHFVQETLLQIASGVGAAHAAGVIHRDLKPSNIFVTAEGQIKVLDFGVAKLNEDLSGGEVTASGLVIGTPKYMAPEQALGRNKDVDARSDIYSLGVISFTLLCGRAPFLAEAYGEILVQHIHDPVPALETFRKNLHGNWESFVKTCMAKAKTKRFRSMDEVTNALENIFSATDTNHETLTLDTNSEKKAPSSTSPHRSLFFLILLIGGLTMGTLAAFLMFTPQKTPPPDASSLLPDSEARATTTHSPEDAPPFFDAQELAPPLEGVAPQWTKAKIVVDPWGDIYVDGKKVKTGTSTTVKLKVGQTIKVKVDHPQLQSQSRRVTGQKTSQKITFRLKER